MTKSVQYRFGDYVLSCSQRVLTRRGAPVALIPRYFDLLVLLVEERERAVHRREIFETVWSDVVVSDGALSQAVRSLRRALEDDPREPRFIRTVSRHGYQFVFPTVSDGTQGQSPPVSAPQIQAAEVPTPGADAFEHALAVLLDTTGHGDDARREAAEALHLLGTAEALRRLDRRPGHERARALLRDARWDVVGAGPVPLFGVPGATRAGLYLARLRLRRVLRAAEARVLGATVGGGVAGMIAGLVGGLVLALGPGSRATPSVAVVLALIGTLLGGLGAAGVGTGLAAAEAVFRSGRSVALAVCGALGGGLVGGLAHLVGSWTLEGLFGRALSPLGGTLEGLTFGTAAGLGYAWATDHAHEGLATPRGWRRAGVALITGLCCATAGLGLAASGRHLGAMSLDLLARSFPGSQVGLDPIARLVGESAPGRATSIAISIWEGLFFGCGLTWGLTRRPRA